MSPRPADRWRLAPITVLSLLLALAPLSHAAAASQTTFSGQATVVDGTVAGIPITLADTGPIAPEGGALSTTLLCYPGAGCDADLPDLTNGMLRARVLHAATVAQGNTSHAQASVAELSLVNVAGNTVSAEFLRAEAEARCAAGRASVTGTAEVADLVVNGQRIEVTGGVNQRVPLPGGGVVIVNEQAGSAEADRGDLTVRALHVVVPGALGVPGTDLVVAEAHADVLCGQPQPSCNSAKEFVTGGGYILGADGAKKHFAVAGGIKNGAFWGHLVYADKAVNLGVKGTAVTAYAATPTTLRLIDGRAEINRAPGTYHVEVADDGEPGRGVDDFLITLSTGYTAGGPLAGGNLQLHHPC